MRPPRRGSSGALEGEAEGELNTVPYLDILMNLILFMLLSLTALAPLGVVNVSAQPTLPPGSVAPSQRRLAVVIGPEGFTVVGGESGEPASLSAPDIPRTAAGAYDYATLSSRLEHLKLTQPAGSKLLLLAAADTPYETVIATMDACRESSDEGRRPLFPEVSLGGL